MLTVERVFIPGEAGLLAGELSYTHDGPGDYLALLLNPHPHMGGSMKNALVEHLAANLPGDGSVALRFDYRGVGGSQGARRDVAASMAEFWWTGRAPEDDGMLGDARAALGWARSQLPGVPVVPVGYSFGAAAAARLVHEDMVAAAIFIAPTLRQHDFSPAAASVTPPLLVIYSDDDFATPRHVTESWLSTIDAQGRCIQGGNHFFLGRETDVARACQGFASRVLRPAEAACS